MYFFLRWYFSEYWFIRITGRGKQDQSGIKWNRSRLKIPGYVYCQNFSFLICLGVYGCGKAHLHLRSTCQTALPAKSIKNGISQTATGAGDTAKIAGRNQIIGKIYTSAKSSGGISACLISEDNFESQYVSTLDICKASRR